MLVSESLALKRKRYVCCLQHSTACKDICTHSSTSHMRTLPSLTYLVINVCVFTLLGNPAVEAQLFAGEYASQHRLALWRLLAPTDHYPPPSRYTNICVLEDSAPAVFEYYAFAHSHSHPSSSDTPTRLLHQHGVQECWTHVCL